MEEVPDDAVKIPLLKLRVFGHNVGSLDSGNGAYPGRLWARAAWLGKLVVDDACKLRVSDVGWRDDLGREPRLPFWCLVITLASIGLPPGGAM
jgi:hypothetical protein